MNTLAEIKRAIAQLDARDRALLAAEFLAFEEPAADDPHLLAALSRGLADVAARRVSPAEDVRQLISTWLTRS